MWGKHHHATIESEQVFLKLGKQHTYISWLMPKSIQLNVAVRGVLYLFQTSALFLGLHLRLCTPRNEVQLCFFICMIIKEKIADCIWICCLYSSNIYLTNRIGWIEIWQKFSLKHWNHVLYFLLYIQDCFFSSLTAKYCWHVPCKQRCTCKENWNNSNAFYEYWEIYILMNEGSQDQVETLSW